MSDPYLPPEPDPPRGGGRPPSPFDAPGQGTTPGSGRSGGPGVKKPLLIGCGVLLLLVFAAFALFVVYQHSIFASMLEAIHGELEPRLPEDLPDDVRARYQDAFEMGVAAVREGDYRPQDLQRLLQDMSRMLQESGSRLSVEEVERLAAGLEALPAAEAGGAASEEEPGPVERL